MSPQWTSSRTVMAFGAVFVPDFFLQAAVRSEPGIRSRPLVLVDGPAPTFRVMAVNRLASQLGLTLGLTKTAAAEFQGVEIRPRRKELEEAAHAALLDAAWSVSPRVEDTAVDTVLIDLAGLTTLFGSYQNIARQMKTRCSALGLGVHLAGRGIGGGLPLMGRHNLRVSRGAASPVSVGVHGTGGRALAGNRQRQRQPFSSDRGAHPSFRRIFGTR